MKRFAYTLNDRPTGIDMFEARRLCEEARKYKSSIVVHYNGDSANALRSLALFQMLSQDVKFDGKTVEVTIEGQDEDIAAPIMEAFFKNNF